jgi:hypothetical protein
MLSFLLEGLSGHKGFIPGIKSTYSFSPVYLIVAIKDSKTAMIDPTN